jgi:hypothetical protein
MKNLLLLLFLTLSISCNKVSEESVIIDNVVIETPIITEEKVTIPLESSDSMRSARVRSKDTIVMNGRVRPSDGSTPVDTTRKPRVRSSNTPTPVDTTRKPRVRSSNTPTPVDTTRKPRVRS